MDFLSDDNICGQNILRITSRGSAIIAELFRLAGNIPEEFFLIPPNSISSSTIPQENHKDNKGAGVTSWRPTEYLFDFQYLRDPDEFEKKINSNSALFEIDHDFQENHQEIMERFYNLFESIWKYQLDFNKYIEDVMNGSYIQQSIDNILQEVEGKQLLCEALYIFGIMLLLLEDKIPGFIRERMLVSLYRMSGEGVFQNFDEVCKLCRNTGYVPASLDSNGVTRRPKNHPESYLARFAPNEEMVRLVIGRLQTDDIYLMANSYPNPDHRSTRLAAQASMLFVILYFSPDTLIKQKQSMREIVDKYFHDNFVISTYMGQVYDLVVEWNPYPAAKQAIDAVITTSSVKSVNDKNAASIDKCLEQVRGFLKEGVLQQDYLLANMTSLLDCVRFCNITLRWRLLHRRCRTDSFHKMIESAASAQQVVTLLLNVSQMEFLLKELLTQLLSAKEEAWTEGRQQAVDRIMELSEYFSGDKALTKVKRDENMMRWFIGLADQVKSLNIEAEHAKTTGRKIQGLVAALEDVEQFEVVDTNAQIKSYLTETRDIFQTMIRTINVKNEVMHILENVTDLSYAWQILDDYINVFHDRIKKDPSSVVLLRATFLKTASILDVPLIRISAIDSPDVVSVAEYYSGELVEFVRLVLEIIPMSVFTALSNIVSIQTNRMIPIPGRLEAKDLKDFAQLDVRFDLAKITHEISMFTEGILVMEKTLLGVIQIEPRQILEEGLRRELVRQVASAMHTSLTFRDNSRQEINQRMTSLASSLDGLKRSIEYLQDYIGLAGLKIYQQELGRIVTYNTEQEANRFLKKKILDSASRFQSKAVPIPRFPPATSSPGSSPLLDEGEEGGNNFMGRVMASLLALTDSSRTVYVPECSAWFLHSAPDQKSLTTHEVCGIRTFALLERSIGVIGLRGLDRLLSFRTVHSFNGFLKFYSSEVHPFRTLLDQIREALHPEHRIPPNASKIYMNGVKKVENLMLPMLQFVRKIGQGQLLRRQIANLLQFGCQLDAHLLFQALDTFNRGLLNDIKRHYSCPDEFPYPSRDNPLLFETTALLEACGLDDPMHKIYVTSDPLEGLPVLLFLFLLTYLPKLEYDGNLGALVRKKGKYPLDGIPLVVGISCVLKQFHPSYSRKLLSYLGQFVRSNLQMVLSEVDVKPAEVPREILNTLVFMDQLCTYSSIPRTLIHSFVPPYIFDALKFSSIPIKK